MIIHHEKGCQDEGKIICKCVADTFLAVYSEKERLKDVLRDVISACNQSKEKLAQKIIGIIVAGHRAEEAKK